MILIDIEDIKASVAINANMSIDTLSPYIAQVESIIAKKVLGTDLYAILQDISNNGGGSSEENKLLAIVKKMIANFAVYEAAPQTNLTISDLGVQEQRSTDGSSSPAQLWRYNDLRISLFRAGDNYREMAYAFLQEHQSAFPLWVSSPSYTIFNYLLLRTTQDFHENIGKGENTNTYLTLRPFIELAQLKYIQPVLCESFLEDILGKVKQNEVLTQYEERVIFLAKKVLAWAVLYDALPSLRYILIDGVMVTAMPGESSKVYAPVSIEERNEIRLDAYQKMETWLSALKAYLKANADNLPVYSTSTCYNLLNKNELCNDLIINKNSIGIST